VLIMMLSVWRLIGTGLLLACLGSYAWGMRRFFAQPAGDTAGMAVIRICGAVFAVVHAGALIFTPGIEAGALEAAIALYLAALGLYWWAIRTNSPRPLSAAFSPDTPQHLVERGPYQFIRHPFYCSYLLTWSGGVVATRSLWLLPSLVVMLVIYIWAARAEEDKFMRSPLAGLYRTYRSRTGLFLPNPFKLFVARRAWRAGEVAGS
jgi:protein-S-isoprenylcysteine O-methyltransferase Ste14